MDKDNFIEKLSGKTVLLDTSSILLINPDIMREVEGTVFVFEDSVLKELDDFKKNSHLAHNARRWFDFIKTAVLDENGTPNVSFLKDKWVEGELARKMLKYSSHTLFKSPVGRLNYLLISDVGCEKKDRELDLSKTDDRILALLKILYSLPEDALKLNGLYQNEIVFLTNDNPLLVRARIAFSRLAQGSMVTHHRNYSIMSVETSKDSVELCLSGTTASFTGDVLDRKVDELSDSEIGLDPLISYPYNTYSVVNKRNAILLSGGSRKNVELGGHNVLGIRSKNIEQEIALDYLTRPVKELPIVSIRGMAGSGKSLLAIASGLKAVQDGEYDRVVILRSLHEMGVGQEMGFLPGDVEEKMSPWSGAVRDSVDFITKLKISKSGRSKKKDDGEQKVTRKVGFEKASKELLSKIDVIPITYLRGRSLSDCFIIVEEAQNYSRSELLNIISRVADGSKVVLAFDPDQVDNKYLSFGDKSDVIGVVKSFAPEPIFAHVELKDSIRSVVAETASRILRDDYSKK